MNQKAFLKVAGKSFADTFNDIYQFDPVISSAMDAVDAWGEGYLAAVHSNGKYDFHLVYAGNGTHFKYDGPGSEYRCFNLFVHDTVEGEAWMSGCLIYRGAKEAKAVIRRYRDIAINSSVAEIEETRAKEKNGYPWRYIITKGDEVASIRVFEDEAKKATEKVA